MVHDHQRASPRAPSSPNFLSHGRYIILRRVDADRDRVPVARGHGDVLLGDFGHGPGQVPLVELLAEDGGAVLAEGGEVGAAVVRVRGLRLAEGVFLDFLSLPRRCSALARLRWG